MVNILAFTASHRKESTNRILVKLAANIAAKQGALIDFAEYGQLDMPIYDDDQFDENKLPAPLIALQKRLEAAHGIMIASPEYNWSFPGSLKNIIDWVSRLKPMPFAGKTAFLLSASPSLKGGVVGLTQLRLPLEFLGVHVYPQMYTLSLSHEKMATDGTLKEALQQQLLEDMVTGFVKLTKAIAEVK
jgi:NAD(P)H-dependent FMN reductase